MFRLQMTEGADGARKFADAHVFRSHVKAAKIASHLRIPVQKLQPEGGGLGVYTMGATDRGRVLEFDGATPQNIEKAKNIGTQDGGGSFDLQSLRGIDHIVRSEAVVQPARLGPNLFADGGGEGNHVMANFRLNLLNAVDINAAALANGARRLCRNDAKFGQGLRGSGFDLQPHAVLVFFRPDVAHGRARVACDHGRDPCRVTAWVAGELLLSGCVIPSSTDISS
jgi:hypothetical protein